MSKITSEEILKVWNQLETDDPNISDEMLQALTMDMTGCTFDQWLKAVTVDNPDAIMVIHEEVVIANDNKTGTIN